MSDAVNLSKQVSAELDLAKQNSFRENENLQMIDVLQLKKEKLDIDISRLKWYLDRSKLYAKSSGILVLDDSQKWTGKSVNAGEKLFEIVNSKKIIAEVKLNEAESSVLGENTKIVLFLHAKPEKPIFGKIISISPKPILSEAQQFSYIIKVQLDKLEAGYIFGMRGVARVQGSKVSLGYYLFRNVVLWWRKV
jgi:multidrug resistance efflux pump